MLRIASLALALGITWLLWSGYYNPLLLGLGFLSITIVLIITRRMNAIDEEGVPVQLAGSIFSYWIWLIGEIFKSNLHVARVVLSPRLNISPTLVKVPARQKSELGQVLFANSIILTPGTLSIDLYDNQVQVHALTVDAARNVLAGEMNDRAARVSNGRSGSRDAGEGGES